MLVEVNESFPLPDDPILAEVAVSIRDSHDWAWIVDRDWRLRYMTDEHRLSFGAGVEMVAAPLGEYLFGPRMAGASVDWLTGLKRPELWGPMLRAVGGLMLTDAEGSVDQLRADVDPALHGIFESPRPPLCFRPLQMNTTEPPFPTETRSRTDGQCFDTAALRLR